MSSFNVNMEEVIAFTAKLEKLKRSDFPIAVRQTLNDAAFETKKLVPKMAAQRFTTRQKNFFNAFSVVDKATGWDVNKMRSITGINENKGSKVAKGLEQQELGGSIRGRKLVPHDMARISGSHSGKLSTRHRFKNINKIHNSTPAYKYGANKGRKSKFASAAFSASKAGAKYFLLKNSSGKGTVFELKSLQSNSRTRKLKMNFKPVYKYRNTDVSKFEKRPFMEPSALKVSKRMADFYIKNAEKRFIKALQ